MNRTTIVLAAAGVPQYSSLAVRVIDCPGSQVARLYGPDDGVVAASYSPGLKCHPVFQNVETAVIAAASSACTAAMMSATPDFCSTTWAGRNVPTPAIQSEKVSL